jgi:hypothetical protein
MNDWKLWNSLDVLTFCTGIFCFTVLMFVLCLHSHIFVIIFISLHWVSLSLSYRLPNCHYVLQNMQAIWEMQETLNGKKWNSNTFYNLWTSSRHWNDIKAEFLLWSCVMSVLHYSQYTDLWLVKVCVFTILSESMKFGFYINVLNLLRIFVSVKYFY